jgi:hypothetical protein
MSPKIVPETGMLVKAQGEAEFTVLVGVKARPLLVITKPAPRYQEVLALRLKRLSTLEVAEQRAVIAGDHPELFSLRQESFPGLPQASAAIISTSLRIPVAAIDTSKPLGELNENELRVVHERLVRYHEFDLRGLILRKARGLITSLQRRVEP